MMSEDTHAPASDISDDRPETAAARADTPPARRSLIVARAGRHRLAVFADESDGVSKFATPAPLPFAPPAVLGVVAVRGRMRTLIDPLQLLLPPAAPTPPTHKDDAAPTLALLLKGDEQLALAVAAVERPAEIPADSILPPNRHTTSPAAPSRSTAPTSSSSTPPASSRPPCAATSAGGDGEKP